REEIRVVAPDAGSDHAHLALIHVILRDKIDPGFGRINGGFSLLIRSAFGPAFKSGAQLLLHNSGIKVSGDAEDNVVGVNVPGVPVQQILTRNGRHRGVFSLARIRAVGPVAQLGSFARGDLVQIVVAARDSR